MFTLLNTFFKVDISSNLGAFCGGIVGRYLGDFCCEWYFHDFQTALKEVFLRRSGKMFENFISNDENYHKNINIHDKTSVAIVKFLRRVKRIYDDVAADRKQKIVNLCVAVIHATKDIIEITHYQNSVKLNAKKISAF